MKEYLDNDYVLRNVKQTSGNNRVPSGWVEIPEGAEVAVLYENNDSWTNGGVYFWKDNGETCYFRGNNSWVNCEKAMFKTLQQFKKDWKGMNSVVWERDKQQPFVETNKPSTKTPFTLKRLLGCYVEHCASCYNGGHIQSVSCNTLGELIFEVEGAEWNYGILAKNVIFYTEDNQPLTFEQYKEMYYGATCNEETSK